jgi:DnaK suppressor protein
MAKQNPSEAPYTTEQLQPVREAMLRRRRELLSAQAAHERDLADEQDRGPVPEEEELAAHQHTSFVSARMREGVHREIQQLDEAMARLDAETYGRCEECDEPISLERLKVLPFTRLCAADAALDERDKVARSPGRSLTF